jgi:hypothetical protein
MEKPLLVYCYDAYCGWCYGFSKVMTAVAETFKNELNIEVLSGGMILPEKPVHIGVSADYILKAIPNVEEGRDVCGGATQYSLDECSGVSNTCYCVTPCSSEDFDVEIRQPMRFALV